MAHKRYTDPDPAIDAKVAELLSGMSLEEKIGQMTQRGMAPGMTDKHSPVTKGALGSTLGVFDTAKINEMQRRAVEESRLGIPLIVGNDVIHGYRTIFPIPLGEACSWDLDLIERTARMAAEEASAAGTDWIFAPMVDIARDGRWGRIAEGSGEDPVLDCAIARARVRGYQSEGLASGKRIVACPKHFVAYGAAESGKDYNTVDLSENLLRDVYLPPFLAALEEGAGSIMSAFNDINGVPASANSFTLRTILREEWDWSGVVLSDAHAVGELIDHGVAADYEDAACQAVTAGVDIDMGSAAYPDHLAAAVRAGKVSETLIDEAAGRVLRLKLMLGLFEQATVDESLTARLLGCREHRTLAREAAVKSMVLLKNDRDALPIKPAGKTIAVIGPLADHRRAPLGCWHCDGRPDDVTTILEGIRAAAADKARIIHIAGCGLGDDEHDGFDDAIHAASDADVAIVVVGEDADMSGEAQCRAYLGLPGVQEDLVEAVAATGTPTVAVLLTGRPLAIPTVAEDVDALLVAWHPGVEAGTAAADLLFGKANPSGKLAVTFPRAVGQIPIYYAHRSTGRPAHGEGTEDWNKPYKSRYRDEWNSPLFPFGFGLSYSAFVYDALQILTPAVRPDGTLRVRVDVTNAGDVTGDEIVQVYVRDVVASLTRPVKELKAFQRVTIAPGETRELTFEIPAASLGFTNARMQYVVEPGRFEVQVGPSSAEGLVGSFQVVE
ncbi:MAG: glycosyl hydrolase [Planctomycetes bacterium]|nr:glycosyl hydrolase [Planctomycetota bacterium]